MCEYMGLPASRKQPRNADELSISSTIAVLARTDDFIYPTIASIRDDENYTIGGHRKKAYQEAFSVYLSKAFQKSGE